ncbi:SbtR family transcriptional regulator [Mycolicibacterium sp. CBM1]
MAADPAGALFDFIREIVRNGATDHGMVEALASYGIDVDCAAPGAEAEFLGVVGEMLVTGQEFGPDVAERITGVIVDGLRAG